MKQMEIFLMNFIRKLTQQAVTVSSNGADRHHDAKHRLKVFWKKISPLD
jgi:hypothetical protein